MTFEPGFELDPALLEEAVRAVDFTPTGVRAWIDGSVAAEEPPLNAPPGALLFVASGSGQRFVVAPDPEGDAQLMDTLRSVSGTTTISGRAVRVDALEEVLIYLTEIGAEHANEAR